MWRADREGAADEARDAALKAAAIARDLQRAARLAVTASATKVGARWRVGVYPVARVADCACGRADHTTRVQARVITISWSSSAATRWCDGGARELAIQATLSLVWDACGELLGRASIAINKASRAAVLQNTSV